jgi:hypothetical protein
MEEETFVLFLRLIMRRYDPVLYEQKENELDDLLRLDLPLPDRKAGLLGFGRLAIFSLCLDHPRELYQSFFSEVEAAFSPDSAVLSAYRRRRRDLNAYWHANKKIGEVAQAQFFKDYTEWDRLGQELNDAEANAREVHEALNGAERKVTQVDAEKQKRKQIIRAEKAGHYLMQDLLFLIDTQNRDIERLSGTPRNPN